MKKTFDTRSIATIAMLTATSVILARLLGFYLTPSLRVSFEYFTIILAGVCLGPVGGALVGGLSDFIGSTILSGLGFYPPLLAGPILAGLTAGLLAKYVFGGNLDKWWKYLVVCMTADILCNLLIGTIVLSHMYGNPFFQYLMLRAPLKIAIAFADAQLVYLLHRAIKPMLNGQGRKRA